MYTMLLVMYLDGMLTDEGLDLAVGKGWISQAQADMIRAEKAAAQGG